MSEIKKVAVLGSGVMGSGIAAVLANAGLDVLLLDIVPKDATERNLLTKGAVERQLKANPPGFTHKENARRITSGNLEDDLEKLRECDWIIEVVIEKLEIKHATYQKIEQYRKEGSIVSSNTSTLPLHVLVAPMSERFKRDFVITHFFNPPRFLPLLEVTGGQTADPATLQRLADFCDRRLGRGIVWVKDTPGFIANRIGVYWLMVGLLTALEMGIRVEDADAVMSKPLGIPKTGVFGLFDLIGIDLMPLIAKEMLHHLPESDAFVKLYREPELVKKLIAEGYTGRKGKGGFYRLAKGEGGKKTKETLDLQSGEYRAEKKSTLESVDAARLGLAALVSHPDIGGQYAKRVLVQMLHYTVSLVPEIADDILAIDEAMRLGYNWKYGPFELIDRLGVEGKGTGADLLAAACREAGLDVPPLLQAAAGKRFYTIEGTQRFYLTTAGAYAPLVPAEGKWALADIKRGRKPVLKNGSAALWDLGDGIAGFELTSKANTFDNEVLELLQTSTERVKQDFKGLVIGSDAADFSFGANLGFFLYIANLAAWPMLSGVIRQGQQAFMGLKYAPFPVVSALAGRALGGGCELNLHADAIQAHLESYPGLVEVGVGVIPGWGGCKEMLLRLSALQARVAQQVARGEKPEALMPQGPMPVVSKAFEYIAMAKVAGSAHEAQEMQILNPRSRITANRARLLADAKALCLELTEGYTPPQPASLHLPGPSGKAALMMALEGFQATGKATPHDMVVGEALATVLSGGPTDLTEAVSEEQLLQLEHDCFMELVKTKGTVARIEHMLETGKPLRN
jgi:3-hydroxyacyl-CoA dehydrogenase